MDIANEIRKLQTNEIGNIQNHKVGCPRERFLAIDSGKAPDFLQAYKILTTHNISKIYSYWS